MIYVFELLKRLLMEERSGTFSDNKKVVSSKEINSQEILKSNSRIASTGKDFRSFSKYLKDEFGDEKLDQVMSIVNKNAKIMMYQRIIYNMNVIIRYFNNISKWHYGKFVILWLIAILTLSVIRSIGMFDELLFIWLAYLVVVIVLTWRWLSTKESKI